ncbi:MAG TPA: hypothetical protein DC000_08625 [Clostridiales bacterium]|nr:hypothetical protein [Clostridiales bacterium]
MSNNYLTPKETADYIAELSCTKASMSVKKRFLLSFMAGLFISLGSQGFLTIYSDPFLRAAVFPVGLMLIILVGGELFTGNCLMTFGCLNKKINLKNFTSSILQVWFGNLIGSLFVVLLVYFSGMYKPDSTLATTIATVANAKVSLTFTQILLKGILCNILVALGVWFAYTAKDTIGRLFGCWFPVMLFVLCGYEHCVANMFFLPLGALVDNSITISKILGNIIPATIGNFIGGGLLLPVFYFYSYRK